MQTKRRFMGLAAAALAATAVVGAGFSAWVFGGEVRADQAIDVNITEAYNIGELKRADDNTATWSVTLDQGDTLAGVNTGISATNKTESNTETTIVYEWTVAKAAYDKYVSKEYGVVIYVSDAFADYVLPTKTDGDTVLDAADASALTDHAHTGYTAYLAEADKLTVTPTDDGTTCTVTLTYSFKDQKFKYVNKPTTFEAYQTMVNALVDSITDDASVSAGESYTQAGNTTDGLIFLEFYVLATVA